MGRRRRHSAAILLLYYVQAVLVGRALAVGTQTDSEIYSLCNNTWTNKTRVNNDRFFNKVFFDDTGVFNITKALNNGSFFGNMSFSQDMWLFNNTFPCNYTGSEWMSGNESVVTPPPDIDYKASWEDLLFLALLVISALVGTVGNAAVILAFCLYKKVRTTGNTFILNTSIWDLVSSAVATPLMISSITTGLPNCGQPCCAFIGFLNLFSITQSMLTCILIAFNRYVHVVLPLATYKRLFGPIKAFVWVAGEWVTGVLILFPAIVGIYGCLGWDEYVQVCQSSYDDPRSELFFKNVFQSWYWFAVFAISAFYARIYLHVRKSTMAIGQHLGHSPHQVSLQAVKRTKHMFYIFFTFLTLTCPVVVVNYVDFWATFLPKAVFFISFAMFYCNTAVNPIIYTWTLKEFRQAFRSMVRCRRHIVPAPQTNQHTGTVQKTTRTSRSTKVLPPLAVSKRVEQAGPSMPVVDT
ncbi:adenosine receptor A1-like [Branchiostoma floridae x Branchiostoma japonicum]